MPISLDQAFAGSAAPTPQVPPSGISLDQVYAGRPKATRAVGSSMLSKTGQFLAGATREAGRDYWSELQSEFESGASQTRAAIQHLPDIKSGDYKDLGLTVGKGLLGILGSAFSPLTSAVETGPVKVAQTAAKPLYKATNTPPWEQDLLNNFIDEVIQTGAGFIGGDGVAAERPLMNLEKLSPEQRKAFIARNPTQAKAMADSPKPRFRVVGTTESGKPILRQVQPGGAVEAPLPVKSASAAAAKVTNAFDELAMKSESAAQALAQQITKTHPKLGAQLAKRASEKAKAPLAEQVSTGEQSARLAATGWEGTEPVTFHYLDDLNSRMSLDFDAHTINFEKFGVETTSHKMLDTMLKRAGTSNGYVRSFLEKLKQTAPDLPVHFKRLLQDENGRDVPHVGGWYVYKKGTTATGESTHVPGHIEVRKTLNTARTLLHEIVHSATVKFMDENPDHPAVQELNRLYLQAWKRMEAMPRDADGELHMPYGMQNPKEFVAEAMANPVFQDWMIFSEGYRSIREPKLNLWSSFTSALHRVFGIKQPEEARLLHNVMRVTTRIMDLQASGSMELAAGNASKAAAEAYRLADRGDAFESLSNFSREKLGLGTVTGKLREYWRFVQNNIAPESLGIEAKKAGATIAEAIARRVQSDVQWYERGKVRRDFWTANPGVAKQFIDQFEQGKEFSDPTLRSAAKAYESWAKAIAEQDSEIGIDYEPIDHYMPHIFQDAEGVEEWLNRRFGASWTKPGFTKDRTFDLYAQAIKAGFKPKYTNPEDIMQARLQASNMARMKVEVLQELERQGLAVQHKAGDKVPEWLASKYPSPTGEGYWVDKRAARVLHNAFNSRSLWTTTGPIGDAFRGLMRMKNLMVPIRLAISLFHPLHIATIHNVTGMVRASKELFSGKISPLEWGGRMAKEMTVLWSNIEDSSVGSGLLRAYRGKIDESQLSDADRQSLQYMVEGGMTPELSLQYRGRAMENFHNAVVARSVKALWHAPFAALDAVQSLVFQKWIPSLKVASYLKDVQSALKTKPELAGDADARRLALRQIAKSVDNRYGEMAYNTLFWNRWVKDLAVANTLSLGWQLGFLREFGGGALDAGRAIVSPGSLGERVKSGLLDRSMFSTYYLTTTLGYGGLLTWAMTGKPPSSLIDYIYPQTGEVNADGKPQRTSTMFYTREIASLYDHIQQEGIVPALGDIAKSKAAGQIGLISEWALGVNDFGQEIRDPEAPAYKQLEQTLAHTLIDLEPISVSQGQGKSAKDKALALAGFTQAPAYATRSAGESAIEQTYQKYYAPKETPYDRALYSQDTRSLRVLYDSGKTDEFDDALDALQQKYSLDSGQVKRLVRSIAGGKDSYATMFQHFTVDQQRAALKKMTPEEREKYLPRSNREHREELEEEFGG